MVIQPPPLQYICTLYPILRTVGIQTRSGFFYSSRPVFFLSAGRWRPSFCVGRRVFNGRCKLVLAARGCAHTVLYQPRLEYHWPIDFVRNSIYCSHVPPEINPSLVQVNTIQLTVTSPHLMIYRECREMDHELPGRAPSAPPPIFDALLYRSGDAHQVNGEIRTYLSRQGRS